MQFTSPETGWSVGGSGVAKTIDGGRTWSSTVVTGEQDQSLDSLFFISAQEGWVVGESVYYTSDGGQSWERLTLTPVADPRVQSVMRIAPSHVMHNPALWFTDPKSGLMARLDGEVYRTDDGGRSWRMVWRADKSITDVFFLNRLSGWLVGNEGLVARTADGGQTWSLVSTPTKANLTNVVFINERVGCTVGYDGTILYTKDGGATWKQASISGSWTPSPLASVSFADELHGWAVGGNSDPATPSLTSPSNVILATQDGGQTWRAIQL